MSIRSPNAERNLSEADRSGELPDDPRWRLVERIIASPSFAKTERLTSFLACICQLAQTGQLDKVNEQYIGSVVFGRSPDYDPGVDSIVRSHASRLRHRLQQYYAAEGAEEELLLSIPKGGYVPIFEARTVISSTLTDARPDFAAPSADALGQTAEPSSPVLQAAPEFLRQAPHVRTLSSLRLWLITALVLTSLLAAASIGMLVSERRHPRGSVTRGSDSAYLFWSTLFNSSQRTTVVHADSGLVILQDLTRRRVSLDDYLTGDYLRDPVAKTNFPPAELGLGTRRYTSIIDLAIEEKILRQPGVDLTRTQFRFARDLRMNDVKEGNLVLLGTYESTPWVQLFEPTMNFYFQNDFAAGVFSVLNRKPLAREQSRYDYTESDPQHTVYGVVAYRPALSGSGKVLILEGQTMAGTESAADFVFDDGHLLPFLRSIQRPDGSIPYFEVLLRSKSINVESSRVDMIAYRVEN